MKKIIAIIYYLALLATAAYLWYAWSTGVINYNYTRNLDSIFLAILLIIIAISLLYSIRSHSWKKKWILIVLYIALIIMSELWLGDTKDFIGWDVVKLVSVFGIFLSLFWIFSDKKLIVKWEYNKKVEIIEV